MPVYTLYLVSSLFSSTFPAQNEINYVTKMSGTTTSPNLNTSTTWNINWDEMFKKNNYKYKKCRVRVKAQSILSDNTALYPTTVQVLTSSFQTNHNGTESILPTSLSTVYFGDTAITNQLFTVYLNTHGSIAGTNIEPPQGQTFFTLAYQQRDTLSLSDSLVTLDIGYLFTFELYDPIL